MAKKIGLTERLKSLLLEGAKQCGLRNADAYFYIEERLYLNEAEDVENFINWCVKHNKGFGHGNIRQVWNEWSKSEKMFYVEHERGGKYVINFHDGVTKHSDGSRIFRRCVYSTKKLNDRNVQSFIESGYVEIPIPKENEIRYTFLKR